VVESIDSLGLVFSKWKRWRATFLWGVL